MKKTISGALSLLLVLVMLIGVMPVALADGTLVLTPASASLTLVNGTASTTVTAFGVTVPDGWTATYVWSGATGNSASATYTAPVLGASQSSTSENVSCTVTLTKEGETPQIFSAETSITTSRPSIEDIIIEGVTTAEKGDTVSLKVKPVPGDALLPAGEVSWTGATGGVVDTSTTGMKTITATLGTLSDDHTVNVTSKKVKLTGGNATVDMKVNETGKYVGVAMSPADATAGITYTSTDPSIVAVASNGALTAKKAGSTTVVAELKLSETNADYEIEGDTTFTTTVNVTDGPYISCSNQNTQIGSSVGLSPVLYLNSGTPVVGATFTAEASGCTVTTTDNKNFYVSNTGAGTGTVTFTANTFKGSDGATYTGAPVTKTVTVSFYSSNTLKVQVKNTISSFRFSDVGIATSATSGLSNITNVASYSMAELIGLAIPVNSISSAPTHYSFSVATTSGGELTAPTSGALPWTATNKQVAAANLGTVGFTQKSSVVKTTTFTIYAMRSVSSEESVIVGALTVELTAGDTVGIKYSTTYNKSVTFNANDFVTYWNTNKLGTGSTLTHVYFGVSNTIPTYGKLYNSTAKTTAVTSAMKFVPSTIATTGTYSLNAATYVPNTNYTSEYSVEIPFTAYGTNNQMLSGYVTIKLNEKSNVIDARGVTLGTTISDSIAANYYTATSQALGYVVFELPSIQYGTLYRSIPRVNSYSRVTEAARVVIGDKFYYSTVTGQMPMNTVSFVPAAGYDGLVTLSYTAYNAGGASPYSGTVTFDVQTKSASSVFSDVTAKNYSWASDSVDFLYYEGTAQGSNGKYNPAANITRGDFMLMLYRAFLENDYSDYSVTSNFPDVVKGTSTYSKETYQAVGIAKYLGIAQGTNGYFNPKANITRQEAMVLIYRTLDVVNRDLTYTSGVKASTFKDYSKIGSWAVTAITDLVSHGVIQGTNDMIKPAANITRAEMAAILHRVITY